MEKQLSLSLSLSLFPGETAKEKYGLKITCKSPRSWRMGKYGPSRHDVNVPRELGAISVSLHP